MVNGPLVLLRVMVVLGHAQEPKQEQEPMAVLLAVDQQQRAKLATLKHVQVLKYSDLCKS